MLVEIPDPEVILGVILAFFVGLGGLYFYFKVRPFIKTKSEMGDISQSERLEYYERQLIDMKIRLDALEIQGIEQKTETTNTELKQILEQITNINEKEKKVVQEPLKKVVPEKDVSPDWSEKFTGISITGSFIFALCTEQPTNIIKTAIINIIFFIRQKILTA